MTEATLQAQLAQVLAPLVRDGSVVINDYHTPQRSSRSLSPWLIIETADEVVLDNGAAWTTPGIRYGLHVGLLTYRGAATDAEHVNAFQALRQSVIAALADAGPALRVRGARTSTDLAPFFREDGEPDPDSLFQRLTVDIEEYEV